MTYAVIQVGSYQYKVQEGSKIETERLDVEKGKKIPIEKVLMIAQDKDVRIGQPYLKDVKVMAEVLDQMLDKRKISFKYRKRKDSASKVGHRQQLTLLTIKSIDVK